MLVGGGDAARAVPGVRDEVPDHGRGHARRGRARRPPAAGRAGSPIRRPPPARSSSSLADLGYLPRAGVDGKAGPQTRFAVMAFQKWARLAATASPGRDAGRARRPRRPTPRTRGGGRRVEVLLDRQLALSIEGGRVVRTCTSRGRARLSRRRRARFRVFRKEQRSWSVPYKVWLPWASYFVGGVAFHESPDVPVRPASHGCVRVPAYDARWLYDRMPDGTPVTVLGTSREPTALAPRRRAARRGAAAAPAAAGPGADADPGALVVGLSMPAAGFQVGAVAGATCSTPGAWRSTSPAPSRPSSRSPPSASSTASVRRR